MAEAMSLPRISKGLHPDLKGGNSVDLCSGLGGFSLASRMLGMEPVAAIDTWDKAKDAYTKNFPHADFTQGDVANGANLDKVAAAAKKAGGCTVLLAGPPCQGFSQILNGNHKRVDPRREVIKVVPKALAKMQPKVFVIENVAMLANYQKGAFLKEVLEELKAPSENLRYEVQAAVYDAATFGVPQQRRRIFIVGVQKGEGELTMPNPPSLSWYFSARRRGLPINCDSKHLDEMLANEKDDRLVNVAQALGDLPGLQAGVSNEPRPYAKPAASAYQRWIRKGRKIATSTGTPRITDGTAKRLSSLRPGQCQADLTEGMRNGLVRKYFSAYRRLHPGVPATTLFTKIDCAYHHSATRALSLREYARLQSIPDSYEFPGAVRHAYAMVGNAVPPLMVARLLNAAYQG